MISILTFSHTGAIWSNGEVEIYRSTISGNDGGALSSVRLTLYSSIVSNNTNFGNHDIETSFKLSLTGLVHTDIDAERFESFGLSLLRKNYKFSLA